MHTRMLLIVVLCAAGLLGCDKSIASPTNPDLVPVADPRPGFGFAVTESVGGDIGLVITVKNQGQTDAAATTTTVRFRSQNVDLPTSAIPAGATVTLHVSIPGPCFQPDCPFEIEVDSKQQINETSESNNKGSGGIIG
jgi:CARDB protein